MKKGKKKWKDLNLCSDVFIHQCEESMNPKIYEEKK